MWPRFCGSCGPEGSEKPISGYVYLYSLHSCWCCIHVDVELVLDASVLAKVCVQF